MSFSIGIVGLPNVGKSTLFKALTKKQVDAANYPFCTIDPNVGVVGVPDERLEALTKISNSAKTIYTTIEFVDIAGLVKGAHKGEGLGNQFLANIRECDAIAQVVRAFSDPNVIHVDGKVNPESDKETINLELIFADLQTLQKRISKNAKDLHANLKEAKEIAPVLEKLKAGLDAGQLASQIITDEKEKEMIADLHLLTMKPMIYVLNVDESACAEASADRDKILKDSDYIAISAKIESELAELPPEEAKEYLKELKLDASGLDRLIKIAYETLNLITFLTSGPAESRAWTVKKGAKAPQAAGVIHTDFEKAFIRAEVIDWQDFVSAGGEAKAKEKGLIRTEGKDYIIKDGDVCHFKVGV
ncbi:MAG: redox-regulated ATPase YchF [Candidatus Buchananbacteria bacterium RIFCSPHIGHO2_01_FULL_46_12]|uniref:Ribosome-binding ATPase YchF n=1 Tax=Candidatus Buchananbacteria bacterium RIFCSPHIGHO2_01_FULL_46_12 TaxID=1797536 RepID=A0A1G1Y9C6_9BACT|nr:MAG: redox-regulated ATPase YchF [Candidatus Buchananbacteria bacterium RIFCSPHIGHO2_01_FULL_46_12]